MFTHPEIDLYTSKDPTLPGDGVVIVGDSIPYSIGIGLLTVAFFVILILFYRRMWELHEKLFGSTTRMSRVETQRAVGSAAYKLADRVQALAVKASDDAVTEAMRKLYEDLYRFGLRRIVPKQEISWVLNDIERTLGQIPRTRSTPVKDSEKTKLFEHFLTDFAKVAKGVAVPDEAQRIIDSAMDRCLVIIKVKLTQEGVSEDVITKVMEKKRPLLDSARLRCIAEANMPRRPMEGYYARLKRIKKGDFKVAGVEHPLIEMARVINEITQAILVLPPSVEAKDQAQQKVLLARDLREWVEVTKYLAYAGRWNIAAQAWFFGRG